MSEPGPAVRDPMIRPAQVSDEPALLRLMADFNRIEQIPWDETRCRGALTALLQSEELGRVMVLEAAGELWGYFVLTFGYDLEFGGRDGFLTELYVAPARRRQGLGRRLLARAERAASELGVRALHLGVLPGDERALSLYRSVGFEPSPYVFLTKRLSRG